jgi:hypothetical protein
LGRTTVCWTRWAILWVDIEERLHGNNVFVHRNRSLRKLGEVLDKWVLWQRENATKAVGGGETDGLVEDEVIVSHYTC